MNSPIESLILAVFHQYPDLPSPFQYSAEEDRPEEVGVNDIGRSLPYLLPDPFKIPDLGDRIPVEPSVGRHVKNGDIRRNTGREASPADDFHIPSALVPLFHHGKQMIPRSSSEVVGQENDPCGAVRFHLSNFPRRAPSDPSAACSPDPRMGQCPR